MAAYERRSYKGNVSYSITLAGDISSGATSIPVSDGSTLPDGSGGPFTVTIDPGTSEEKVQIASRSGNTLTVAIRGYDGTAATTHSSGVPIQHTLDALDFDEANQLVHALLTGGTTGQVVTVDTGLTPPIKLAAPAAASGAAGGDLSGTYPNPAVAKVNGVAVTGTPTSGQVPIASSGTAAAWGTLTKTHRLSFTYAFSGAVGNVTLPLFEVGLASGETKALVKVITKLSAGTITAQVTRNGSNLGSAISVTSTKLSTAMAQALSDGDDLAVVLSAGSGATDLTVTFMVDSTA